MFLYSYYCCVLLGETLNTNDVELLERERISLDLDLCTVVLKDAVDSVTLRNEEIYFLIKACVENGVTSHNYNKIKVKVKDVAVLVHDSSTESTLKERTCSDGESKKKISR